MAETLSAALENQRREKKITGIQIAKGVKNVNHIIFADDTLLLGGASSIIVRRFKKVLDDFLQGSGGMLDYTTCRIYSWNTPPRIMQNISQILEIPIQARWTHFTYLGLPIAKENIKAEVWSKQVEKMKDKIQKWGMMWLNLAS